MSGDTLPVALIALKLCVTQRCQKATPHAQTAQTACKSPRILRLRQTVSTESTFLW
ncbi:hypothetical protein Mal48_31720 [Thalassoglobus polymorphus]|uniref:Uncharacterized protein n=1 Tax=Thalassoglobus polymorphus TaxID=2527994 RepID=A0A517QQK1_9PLAN|nr:hypothetical protein Mal48_31720 [Thalassoglobus polymorphus]